MKMNQQMPGGEEMNHRTMKGCEKFMKKGKGNLTSSGYVCGGMTKGSMKAPGLKGIVGPGKARGR